MSLSRKTARAVSAFLCLGHVCVVTGCGAATTEPVTELCIGGVDESDNCSESALHRRCLADYDFADDGCPRPHAPEVRFEAASVALADDAEHVLNLVCADALRLWPGASLRLVAVEPALAADRIEVVRAALVACGVPAARIRVGGPLPEPELAPWQSVEDAPTYAPNSVVVTADSCAL